MRRVASKAMRVLLAPGQRAGAFWVSAGVVAVMSLWRGAAAVISDVCANTAGEFLSGWFGRTGEWLIIAAVLGAYTLHTRRLHRRHARASMRSLHPRRLPRRSGELCLPRTRRPIHRRHVER